MAAGKTLAQANYVSVGHLELVARWLDRDLSPITQKLADWQRGREASGGARWAVPSSATGFMY